MRMLAVLFALCAVAGCRFDSTTFYAVIRTPTDACDILPTGEFCRPADQIPAPTTEGWAVERVGSETRVYVDEEVWIANPPAKDADPDLITADSLAVDSRDPGPCTTTTTRSFSVLAKSDALSGQIDEKTRLVGAADCGDTPRGLRTVASLAGTVAGAP